MRFDTVLFDADDTLLDFRASSHAALVKTFAHLHEPFTWDDMRDYEQINNALWRQFERGEIEKDYIYPERFRRYLAQRGLRVSAEDVNAFYMLRLAEGADLMPHSEEILKLLYGKCTLCVVTNGDTAVQEGRMARAGILRYLSGNFVSEQLGCKKPEPEFFDKVFAAIGEERRKSAILVGDSLTSDMQGGRSAGIATCFFGPREKADSRCDYVIGDLLELPEILGL
jgi:2-haloacid dehalogenase